MTTEQKKQVEAFRKSGKGFVEIAQSMGLPITTVKSYCYRHPLKEALPVSDEPKCPQCGGQLAPSKFRPRRFCSNACRNRYWYAHHDTLNGRTTALNVCGYCGEQFHDYANRNRKYCSHDCYIAARYGGDRHE